MTSQATDTITKETHMTPANKARIAWGFIWRATGLLVASMLVATSVYPAIADVIGDLWAAAVAGIGAICWFWSFGIDSAAALVAILSLITGAGGSVALDINLPDDDAYECVDD